MSRLSPQQISLQQTLKFLFAYDVNDGGNHGWKDTIENKHFNCTQYKDSNEKYHHGKYDDRVENMNKPSFERVS